MVAVGMTPGGENIFLDLAQAPHLLVGGMSGSGKTVFTHGLIVSLVGKLPPAALDLVLVDPKLSDFSLYAGLPHLRSRPIFTNASLILWKLWRAS